MFSYCIVASLFLFLILPVGLNLHFCNVLLELSWIDFLFKPIHVFISTSFQVVSYVVSTHISSISAVVRRDISGNMNQATTTATAPVPAKLWLTVSFSPFQVLGIDIQKSRLNTPFRSSVYHQWCTEAEQDSDKIREGKRPARSLCT